MTLFKTFYKIKGQQQKILKCFLKIGIKQHKKTVWYPVEDWLKDTKSMIDKD